MPEQKEPLDWGLDEDEEEEQDAPEPYVPTSFDGWFNKGVHHLDQHEPKQAVEAFIKAINTEHDHPEVVSAYSNLGVAYDQLGQLQYAADAYLSAVKTSPDLIEARWGLVKSYLKQGKLVEAVAQLRQIPPGHAQRQLAQDQLAAILAQPQALALWDTALQASPDDPHLHYELGQIYTRRRLPDLAMQHLRRVMELAPEHGEAEALLSVTELEQGQ